WGFYGNVINARGEDLFDVLFKHRQASLSGLGRAKESNPAFGRATTRIPRFCWVILASLDNSPPVPEPA
ncbi:MAG: hypothetical protein QOI97_1803, partial [Pseudomonas sp.]|nr:hypothetical protein [Pseudomonas sp.]